MAAQAADGDDAEKSTMLAAALGLAEAEHQNGEGSEESPKEAEAVARGFE